MCNATEGASPVCTCTWAASAIFSKGSRGVPGVVKTRKRVPELPKAHEGSSMAWRSSWEAMESKVVIDGAFWSVPAFRYEAGCPARDEAE